ncbi:MAG: hypothetical protein KME31_11215 [Tolypothrix carrinoi HA7290-LM1]|nr:hypothetical protein [Tolypothrix carrinoi HA7290-LM1]
MPALPTPTGKTLHPLRKQVQNPYLITHYPFPIPHSPFPIPPTGEPVARGCATTGGTPRQSPQRS